MTPAHYHLMDYPHTLALVDAVLGYRDDATRLGYEATEHGAWLDWDKLTTTEKVSSTETAVMRIAYGLAALERAGGAGRRLNHAVISAVEAVLGR